MRQAIFFLFTIALLYNYASSQVNSDYIPCADTVRRSGFIFEAYAENKKHVFAERKRKKSLLKDGIIEAKIDEVAKQLFFVQGDEKISEAELSSRLSSLYELPIDSLFVFCGYGETKTFSIRGLLCRSDLRRTEEDKCNFPVLKSDLLLRVKGLPKYISARGGRQYVKRIYKIYYIEAEWLVFQIPSEKVNLYFSADFPVNRVGSVGEKLWVFYAFNTIKFVSELEFSGPISPINKARF